MAVNNTPNNREHTEASVMLRDVITHFSHTTCSTWPTLSVMGRHALGEVGDAVGTMPSGEHILPRED